MASSTSTSNKLVESALVASPELAENLRALTAVRELVAGLPRDAGADISPEVMRRIRGLNRSRSLLSSIASLGRAGAASRGRRGDLHARRGDHVDRRGHVSPAAA